MKGFFWVENLFFNQFKKKTLNKYHKDISKPFNYSKTHQNNSKNKNQPNKKSLN
jgi:hypothetical protein